MSFSSSAGSITRNPAVTEANRLHEIKQRIALAQAQMDRSFDTLELALMQMSDARAQIATLAGVINQGSST
ncbi:hypothetical protein SAMN06265338_103192 [Rhodoblastus acidophilus]|uniref:Uncharacterized protein n=1 Tax=Rhodoblastus acidophilus TaxID=1074 RepID=A0A212RAN2_RHOAC|nr:hypothetical protein [Rhodoblastus acidophilus]PPQ39349.1 hypothetical protein CKO16_06235 [Rhodoblastus acidophilus]RAI22421.1 hypothetical protein CH337_05430 [Rhodoblastus acidophilus]SNB69279.1 hypothetical protein SAMN06265338_103192 [Rhodoblastus acidophilus]